MQLATLQKHKINLVLLIVFLSFCTKLKAEVFNPTVNIDDTSKVKIDTLDNELPGPVFYTGINFDKYKFKIKPFITIPEISYDNAVITSKQNYFEPYYDGIPFSSGMNNFVYVNEANRISKISKDKYRVYNHSGDSIYYPENQIIKLPKHIIYYLNDYQTDENDKIILDNISEKQLKKILKPFYFSKYEVSIKEYKEFTDWVRKTNGFDSLPYYTKNIKYYDNSIKDTLIKNKLVWVSPKEKVYNYTFYNTNEEIENIFTNNKICVAPCDTIELYFPNTEADYSFFDVNIFYTKEGKYLKYPVMGISYYQALAFLDWKQHFHQKYLEKNYANLEVKYELPNLIDYDLVLNNIGNYDTDNYLCDLQLSKHSNQRTSLDNLLNARLLYSSYDTLVKSVYENRVKEIIQKLFQDWFVINYQITYDGDVISKMSPGKKSFVLLRLIVELDKSKCPLLIDQPEDDLDNRSIYNEVVKFIRQKKKERQIIIVTHNANLVVTADTECVIVANQDGEKNKNRKYKFEYVQGSLENTFVKNEIEEILYKQGIREHVCDILEGGEEAFENRRNKYNF